MGKKQERFRIVQYRPQLAQGMELLRADVAARHGAPCLWDAGDRWLWPDTLCALEGPRLIATAQVRPVVIATAGQEPHWLYVSINALAPWEGDADLYDALYARVMELARSMAAVLTWGHPVLLGASLLGSERAARAFFEKQGFAACLHILAMTGSTGLQAPAVPGIEIQENRAVFDDAFEDLAAQDSPLLDDLGLPQEDTDEEAVLTTLGALLDGYLCGRLMLYERGGAASIEDVFVLPDCRGKGVARALVRSALKLLAERGYERADLQVLADNTAALGLYRGLGFETIGEETRLQRPL